MFVNALLNYPSYLFHQGQHTTSTTPTRDSRADYTVYVIKRRDHPVAVLIEAKHKTHKVVKHALAQVTGYFAAFDILKTIPLVFVLTDVHIQVIIYPFKNGNGDALINGIVLPPFPLFNDDGVPKTLTLGMVLTLANYPEVETLIQLPDGCPSMSRVALGGIVLTEQQAELAKHEAEIRQYREEIRQLREQLKRTRDNTVSIFGCTYMYNLCDVKVTGMCLPN